MARNLVSRPVDPDKIATPLWKAQQLKCSLSERIAAYTNTESWVCPDNPEPGPAGKAPHHWKLDINGHGKCVHCGAER